MEIYGLFSKRWDIYMERKQYTDLIRIDDAGLTGSVSQRGAPLIGWLRIVERPLYVLRSFHPRSIVFPPTTETSCSLPDFSNKACPLHLP